MTVARSNHRIHPECPNCICGKRAAVQGSFRGHPMDRKGEDGEGPGSITWAEHELAWSAYAARYGNQQSAQRMHDRGGFSYYELTDLLGRKPETWVPVAEDITTR